ncbi:hypothetical protein [Streptomyces formicae]|uniref:Uncharacterized protein n=1 Tax=Streptomyces formicae TaxID=1616117 RepID=A0A291QBX1_9ACTN|nr:hypothetical protein [Streptomyces formicae]ATL29209.1 hypothetical protein KY5_4191 [Streptomyces formicae]
MNGCHGRAPDAAWATVRFGAPSARAGAAALLASVSWCSGAGNGLLVVRLSARPPGCDGHPPRGAREDVHLWADPDTRDGARVAAYADVLVTREPLRRTAAGRRAAGLLARHAGCLVAVAPVSYGSGSGPGCAVAVRDGGSPALLSAPESLPPHAVASLAHAWLARGGSPGALGLTGGAAVRRAVPRRSG